MTLKDKLNQARIHIQRKQYDEARALLTPIQYHPTAKEWLSKLDEISRAKRAVSARSYAPTRV